MTHSSCLGRAPRFSAAIPGSAHGICSDIPGIPNPGSGTPSSSSGIPAGKNENLGKGEGEKSGITKKSPGNVGLECFILGGGIPEFWDLGLNLSENFGEKKNNKIWEFLGKFGGISMRILGFWDGNFGIPIFGI